MWPETNFESPALFLLHASNYLLGQWLWTGKPDHPTYDAAMILDRARSEWLLEQMAKREKAWSL